MRACQYPKVVRESPQFVVRGPQSWCEPFRWWASEWCSVGQSADGVSHTISRARNVNAYVRSMWSPSTPLRTSTAASPMVCLTPSHVRLGILGWKED